ncbi:MAG: hypothetical protein NC938_01935 [Candidatus Omnitrophica bacterium]|nr:hypothetical protein [Candidatus Omnitrophota bacterium]MCM8790445.1 hypothetical protein [Candidatus Omnitrophota bacterium]
MTIRSSKGFIIILVTVSLAVLILSASVIIGIGCSELMATRIRNDLLISAYYVAISGCERMYAYLKTLTTSPDWNTTKSGSISVGSNTIGTYSARAYQEDEDEFYIVSTGTVNNHTATATVKLGYLVDYTGPLAAGAYGAVTLIGASNQAKIKMEGPVVSGTSEVSEQGRVDISGDPATIDNAGTPEIHFWLGTPFDTNNDSNYVTDTNSDGIVTRQEAIAQDKESVFNADNAYNNSDDEITEKDAFYYYYTTYLDNAANNPLHVDLNISPGETYHYVGDQTFTDTSITDGVPIVFVDGNCTVTNNDGATDNHTLVVLGNLTLNQPDNDAKNDRNTYVVYGDVYTTGEMGHSGGTKGDLIIFATGNIVKDGGGKMNASFYCNGTLTINTGGDTGKKHLMMSKLTQDWDVVGAPLGIPDGYPDEFTTGFSVKNQTNYPPVWQRK